MARIDKENYYLDIAETVLKRATCLRRCYGAIIVKNDEIVSTGYNGAPRGRKNCTDLGYCTRDALQVPSGERYELCRSVHAEANAIIGSSSTPVSSGWSSAVPPPTMPWSMWRTGSGRTTASPPRRPPFEPALFFFRLRMFLTEKRHRLKID